MLYLFQVSKIEANSAASKDDRISNGDIVLSVNGETMNSNNIAKVMKRIKKSDSGQVVFVLSKYSIVGDAPPIPSTIPPVEEETTEDTDLPPLPSSPPPGEGETNHDTGTDQTLDETISNIPSPVTVPITDLSQIEVHVVLDNNNIPDKLPISVETVPVNDSSKLLNGNLSSDSDSVSVGVDAKVASSDKVSEVPMPEAKSDSKVSPRSDQDRKSPRTRSPRPREKRVRLDGKNMYFMIGPSKKLFKTFSVHFNTC